MGGSYDRADSAEPTAALSVAKRREIYQAVERSPEFRKATNDYKKVVATAASRILYEEDPQRDVMEVLHYRYDDGKTIRTLFNAADNKSIKTEELEAYPTPLADEELEQAKKLARSQEKRVNDLFVRHEEEEVTVRALAPVISDRKNKLYGKRLAILRYMPMGKPAEAVTVEVNLTDGVVLPSERDESKKDAK
ncbi:MAG: hypothetical protein WD063_21630 [Pirellulales bacterium]